MNAGGIRKNYLHKTQPVFTCLKPAIEAIEQGVKYV